MIKDKTKKMVMKMLKEDMSHRDIAKTLKISLGSISSIRNGLSDKPGKFNPSAPMVRNDAVMFVRKHKKGFHLDELAKKLDTTVDNAKKVIVHLSHHDGYNIVPKNNNSWQLIDELPPSEALEMTRLIGKERVFGLVSDTHLCSKFARLDVLEAAYNEFDRLGIKEVLHGGNIIEGECRFNRYEINQHGVHDQSLFVADNYPQRKGIKTYFVTGDCHEGWYMKDTGMKVGWYIQNLCEQNGRSDMIHVGHIEQDIILKQKFGDTRIRLMHPGGGSAYALSYPTQKTIESFQGGDKPHVLLLGHYHKRDICYPREVEGIQMGCMQDQTPFMRKKRLGAHVGFHTMNIGLRVDGTIGRSNLCWYPFYDRKYHQKLNEYNID